MASSYRNFDLEITQIGPIFSVKATLEDGRAREAKVPVSRLDELSQRVPPPPRGGRIAFDEPPPAVAVNHSTAPTQQMASQEPAEEEFGSYLFETFLTDEVLGLFRIGLNELEPNRPGLRIRLHLSKVPNLASLPWEYLYDSEHEKFFALSPNTPIVRFLKPDPEATNLNVEPPLRILVVKSKPMNAPELDVDREAENLKSALRNLQQRRWNVLKPRVILEELEKATLSALEERLNNKEEKEEKVHVLHFIGHGYFHPAQNEGGLTFVDEANGGPKNVNASDLCRYLEPHPSLRLVFLNACNSGQTSTTEPFAGVAQKLLEQGIPAVLAMQYPVSDPAAIELAQRFYRSIAKGLPLEAAVSDARRKISVRKTLEWGTPVLYSQSKDGKLFEIPPEIPKWLRIAAICMLLLIIGAILLAFPVKMKGNEFNVAVADIALEGPNGKLGRSEIGPDLSASLSDEIHRAFCEIYANVPELSGDFDCRDQPRQVVRSHGGIQSYVPRGRHLVEIRDNLGIIKGTSEGDRKESAAKLLQAMGAQLVVYGYFTPNMENTQDNRESLDLYFYVGSPKLRGEPDAISGFYVLGEAIPLTGRSNASGEARDDVLDALKDQTAPRAHALAWIMVGLSKSRNDQHEIALRVFETALDQYEVQTWNESEGQRMLNFLAGREAFWLRDYERALRELETVKALAPDLPNVYHTLATVYFDRAQLYYIHNYGDVPEEQEMCFSEEQHQVALSGTGQDAETDLITALQHLEEARRRGDERQWLHVVSLSWLTEGLVYQLLGQIDFGINLQTELAYTDFYSATKAFEEARDGFSLPSTDRSYPLYQAWAELGLGLTEYYSATLDMGQHDDTGNTIPGPIGGDEANAVALTSRIATLTNAIGHYDQCLELNAPNDAEIIFSRELDKCGCDYYKTLAEDKQRELQDLLNQQSLTGK